MLLLKYLYLCETFKNTNQKKQNMKKTLVLVFSALLTGIGFYGCKKGEGDPMISFKSRDKRLMGEWTVSKIDESRVTVDKESTLTDNPTYPAYNHQTTTVTTSFDGSTLSESTKTDDTYYPTIPGIQTSQTITDMYSKTITLTLDKHGVAKSTEMETLISTTVTTVPSNGCVVGDIAGLDCDGKYTYPAPLLATSSTSEGKWSWLGDNKNKEQVLIDLNGTMGGIYMIEQLKNKEIILKENYVWGDTHSGAGNASYNVTQTGDYTLTGK